MPETQEKTETVKIFLTNKLNITNEGQMTSQHKEVRGFYITDGNTCKPYDQNERYDDNFSVYEGWVRDKDKEPFAVFIRDANEDQHPEEDAA